MWSGVNGAILRLALIDPPHAVVKEHKPPASSYEKAAGHSGKFDGGSIRSQEVGIYLLSAV